MIKYPHENSTVFQLPKVLEFPALFSVFILMGDGHQTWFSAKSRFQ
jgi:hypothetical protein